MYSHIRHVIDHFKYLLICKNECKELKLATTVSCGYVTKQNIRNDVFCHSCTKHGVNIRKNELKLANLVISGMN